MASSETPEQRRARYLRDRDKERTQQAEYKERNKERIQASQAAYRERNREAINAKKRALWAKNKDRYHQMGKRWREQNKEYLKRYQAQWRQEHIEWRNQTAKRWRLENIESARHYARISQHRRRAQKEQGGGITRVQWEAIKRIYHYRCVYCQKKLKRLTQDHVIPLARGGSNSIDNIVPACQSCNSRKHSKLLAIPPPIRLML